MIFLIAVTFTDSIAKLTGEEQKAVKTTAFDLQLNPATTGMRFHKLDGAKDKKHRYPVRLGSDQPDASGQRAGVPRGGRHGLR